MSYKIVKNKPMPEARGGTVKYPLADMKVGDAFEVVGLPPTQSTRSTIASSCRAYVNRHNPKAAFATRVVDGSVWVWRTA